MDRNQLDHLERLARAASEGPWRVRELGLDFFVETPGEPDMPYRLDVCGDDYTGHGDDEQRRANFDYIAATNPTVMLRLIERLREAESLIATLPSER
jgi:hypothetical protein